MMSAFFISIFLDDFVFLNSICIDRCILARPATCRTVVYVAELLCMCVRVRARVRVCACACACA